MIAATPAAGGWLRGRQQVQRLDNGLEIVVLENDSAPVVTTAMTYRFGARDDPADRAGLAHFLEHMMFKGSASYAAGEVDRRTRRLGGSNNAFTSHDATTYFFSFGRDRWTEALDIEADRMRALLLAPEEVEAERAVILEEIAMYQAEPWDALERAVQRGLHREHPYGRPVLGDAEAVRSITVDDLAGAHREAYAGGNAVLVVAGGCGGEVVDAVAERFADLPSDTGIRRDVPAVPPLEAPARIRLERGEVGRLLMALPAPPATHPDLPALRVLSSVLTQGRASRLNRRLVEVEESCGWVSASVTESQLPGSFVLAAELVPGARSEEVEGAVLEELAKLISEPLEEAELDRAQRVLLADWVFGHEQIQQQALTLSQAGALFDLEYPAGQLEGIRACSAGHLNRVAGRYLNPEQGSVVGWSVARS
jgi:zinc protease